MWPLLLKRGNVWHYRFMVDGKIYTGSCRTEKKTLAAECEMRLRTQISDGETLQRKPKMTFEQLASWFRTYVENHQKLAVKTKGYYLDGLNPLLDSQIAQMRIENIRPNHIDQIALPGCGSTQNRSMRCLRRMFHLAAENGWLVKVPKISLSRENQREHVITPALDDKLLNQLRGIPKAIYMLMMDTGARPSELCTLCIEDWERDTNRILVTHGKTPESRRWLYLSTRALDVLEAYSQGRESGWFFRSKRHRSEPIQRNSITAAFAIARAKAGLHSQIKLYSARHTYATDVMNGTGNAFAVQKLLGHTDISTTKRYQHPELANAAQVINNRNAASAVVANL